MNDDPHRPTPTTPPDAATAPSTELAGVMQSDRLCIRCGFNLHGQQIVREPHYQMLAVRCPECSMLASLQEYPVLGTWTRRAWMLLAVVWLVLLLLAGFLTGLSVFATGESAAQVTTNAAAEQIGNAFAAYARENMTPGNSSPLYNSDQAQWWNTRGPHQYIDPAWVQANDMRDLAGGATVRWRALGLMVPALFGCFCWGVLWSVLLLQRRFLQRCMVLTLIALGAAFFVAASRLNLLGQETILDSYNFNNFQWGIPASTATSHLFGLPPGLVSIVLALAALLAGARWGRSIVRGIVRLLLPPFLRGSLAVLWHVDGLPSPPTRHESWVRG